MKPTKRQQEVFDKVNDYMKQKGVTQTEAFKALKLSQSTYWAAKKRIEADGRQDATKPKRAYKKRGVSRKPYTRKAQVFDIPLDDHRPEKVMLFVGSVAEISAILSTMR